MRFGRGLNSYLLTSFQWSSFPSLAKQVSENKIHTQLIWSRFYLKGFMPIIVLEFVKTQVWYSEETDTALSRRSIKDRPPPRLPTNKIISRTPPPPKPGRGGVDQWMNWTSSYMYAFNQFCLRVTRYARSLKTKQNSVNMHKEIFPCASSYWKLHQHLIISMLYTLYKKACFSVKLVFLAPLAD